MRKISVLILFFLASFHWLSAQTAYNMTYTVNGGNPGGLNTDNDDVVTGWNTIINASISTNQWSPGVVLPFSFNFYGSPVTALKASANGLITFDTNTTKLPDNNVNLPTSILPDTSIACFWDGFTSAPPTASNDYVAYKVVGTAPNRQLWVKWASFEMGSPSVSFTNIATVLEETTNKIYLVEGYTSATPLQTMTIGLQLNASRYYQVGNLNRPQPSNNSSATPADNDYYTLTPYIQTNMAFGSTDVTQPMQGNVSTGSSNQGILRIQVVMNGELNPLNATQFVFNTNGSSFPSDISNARLYYTGSNKLLSTSKLFGTQVNTPSGTFTINGTQALQKDTNYFWLTYSINSGATLGNVVDAQCTQMTIGGVTQVPPTLAPTGYRTITGGLTGSYTVGTGGNYTYLSDAFKDINNSGLSGNVTLRIISDIDDTASAVLNDYTAPTGAGIRIVPSAATLRNITGRFTTSLVQFNGSNNVVIDGKDPVSGTGKYLRFANRNDSGSTFTFINGTRFDTVTNTTIEGTCTSPLRGTVTIGTSAGATGNRDLVFTNNDIRDRSDSVGIPTSMFFASGTDGNVNSNITISNNNIFNFRRSGVYVAPTGNGSSWNMSGNSFYYNASTTPAAGDVVLILFTPGNASDSNKINNNYFGGQAPLCGGSALTNGNPYNWVVMNINAGLGTGTSIQGNTIQNINLTATTAGMAFVGIRSESGSAQIGTITGNLIGHPTTAGSITCALPLTFCIYGFTGSLGDVEVANNTIVNIAGNGTSTASGLRGICFQGGAAVPNIHHNTIYNLVSASTGTVASTTALMGIGLNSGSESGPVSVRFNRIYNLSVTNATANTIPTGIVIDNSSVNGLIEGNVIYNITNISTGTSAAIHGIFVQGGVKNMTFRNNMISLSNAANTNGMTIRGISDNASTNSCNYYNNSIYIGGSAASGALNSFAFERRSTDPVVIRNNIFYNARTGGTGIHAAIANVNASPATNWSAASSDYNLLVATKASSIGAWSSSFTGQTFSAWQSTSSGADTRSWSDTTNNVPATLFVNTATADLRIDSTSALCWYANGKGLAMTDVSKDIFGQNRNMSITAGNTDLGAHEFPTNTTPANLVMTGNIAGGDSSVFSFAGRTLAKVYWTGIVPTSLTAKYYSGVKHPNVFAGAKYFNSYWSFTDAGVGSYSFNLKLYYDSATMLSVALPSDIRTAQRTGNWTSYAGTVLNSTERSFTVSNLTNFGDFTGTDQAAPLPVKLVSFHGVKAGNDALLSWTTASEVNADHYELERSADGRSFEQAAVIAIKGNSNETRSYQYADAGAFKGNPAQLYYRLKVTDRDGRFNYSDVVVLNNTPVAKPVVVNVYPNPFAASLTLNVQNEEAGTMQVSVLDMQGKQVWSKSQDVQAGSSAISISELEHMQQGIYFVQYSINGQSGMQKLVKLAR